MSWERYENGTRVERGDDATRTVTTSTGTRPYTAADDAQAHSSQVGWTPAAVPSLWTKN